VNYDIKKFPERWKKFNEFTYNQIEELMTGYGGVDILWLDGGWVKPGGKQSIDMPGIASMARSHQPGLIIVDRTVPGEFENYTTPEQTIPEKPLPYPWETCMSMGDSWSYTPTDKMKPSKVLLSNLVQIVSRGGNFLLNIGPSDKGDWSPEAYDRLKDIGNWMNINGEGIHASEPVAPYSENNIYFTKSKDQQHLYAWYIAENDKVLLPSEISFRVVEARRISKVALMGRPEKLKWSFENGVLTIKVPANLQKQSGLQYIAGFKIDTAI